MTTLAPKRPTEIRRYVFDFSHELGDDEIQAYQIAIVSGSVSSQSDEQISTTCIVAYLAGGVDGQTSKLEIQVTTEDGQLLIRDYSLLTANASNATGSYPSSTTKGQILQMVLAQLGLSGVGYTGTTASTTTKGQVVNMAYEEISLAGYEFDASAAEQSTALQRLDAIMAQLSGPGGNLNVGYNFPPKIGGSAMADNSGIPDILLDAVVCMLALSLAGVIGKSLGLEVKARIKNGITTTRIAYAVNLLELDALMAQWASPGVGLDIGYNFPTAFGGSALTDLSGVPDLAVEAVVLSLARALPIPEKTLSPDFQGRLAAAMTALRAVFARIPHLRLPADTVRGAGAKPWSTWRPFMGRYCFQAPEQQVLGAEDGQIIETEDGERIGA